MLYLYQRTVLKSDFQTEAMHYIVCRRAGEQVSKRQGSCFIYSSWFMQVRNVTTAHSFEERPLQHPIGCSLLSKPQPLASKRHNFRRITHNEAILACS